MAILKKIFAGTAAVAVVAQSFGTASADVSEASPYSDGYSYSYEAPSELKKLVGLELKVVSILDRAAKKEIAKIRDAKTKKAYADVHAAKKAEMKALFSELRSGMKYQFSTPETENARDMLRMAVKGYLEFLSDVRYASQNEGGVTDAERRAVEAETVEFQKDLVVGPVTKILDAYARSDMKETGEWKMSFDSPYGQVNASMDRYVGILSILGFSQEIDFVLKSDFDLDLPGPTRYDPETFERLASDSTKIKGDVRFDANVKIVDDYAYVLLRDYAIEATVSAGGETAEEFESQIAQAKTMLELVKGKTVKIKMSEDGSSPRPDVVLKKLSAALDVLATESLFSPTRKTGTEKYSLELKAQTVARLANVMEEKITLGELKSANVELAKSNLSFSRANGKSSVSARDPKGSGEASMTRSADGYSFLLDSVGATSRSKFSASDSAVTFDSKSKSASVSASWKDSGATEVRVFAMGTEAARLSGTLLLEKADLSLSVSGKEVASIKYEVSGDSYFSDIRVDFEIPEGATDRSGKVSFRSYEKGLLEKGTFEIKVPTDVVDLESLLK